MQKRHAWSTQHGPAVLMYVSPEYMNIQIDSNKAALTVDRNIYSVHVSMKFKLSESTLRSFTCFLSSFVGDGKQLQITQEGTVRGEG